jgi:hypothetical protein
MGHTAVAAYLLRDGRTEAAFGADRSIPRSNVVDCGIDTFSAHGDCANPVP